MSLMQPERLGQRGGGDDRFLDGRAGEMCTATAAYGLPVIVMAFAFLLLALPPELALPGPLRGYGSPARLIALAVLVLIVLTAICGRQFLLKRDSRNVGVGIILLFLAAACIQFARSYSNGTLTDKDVATNTRFLLSAAMAAALLMYMTVRVRTDRQRRAVLWSLLAGSMVSVVIGLLQGLASLNYRYYGTFLGLTKLQNVEPSEREGFTRVVGTTGHPIAFSVMVAVALPIAIHLARFTRDRNARLAANVCVVILLIAVPASVSRTAIVAVVAALLVYAIVLPVRTLLTGLTIIALSVFAYAVVAPRLFDTIVKLFTGASQDNSVLSRTGKYSLVGTAFRESPWLGHGFANNILSGGLYLDNQWLQAIIEGGVIGFGAMVLLVVGGVVAATYGLRGAKVSANSAEQRDLIFALCGSFTAVVVSAATFDEFFFGQSYLLFFLVFALLWTFPSDKAVLASRPVIEPTAAHPLTGVAR